MIRVHPPTHLQPLLALVLLAAFAGCREPRISVYRAPKEQLPAMPTAGATASAPSAPEAAAGTSGVPAASTGAPLAWTAPAHWREKPAAPPRRATFAVPGPAGIEADLSVTSFPGDVGGLLANVNRWRGQVALPPTTAADLPASATPLAGAALPLTLVDLTGPAIAGAASGILGGIVPVGGETWFFKLSGPRTVLDHERAAFVAFLQTIRASAATTP